MNKSIIIIALLCMVGSLGFTQNLVKNGTFDNTPSTGRWTIEVTNEAVASQTSGGNPGGYAWLNHDGQPSDPAIKQTITGLKPGTEYVVEGDYKAGKHYPMHNVGKTVGDFFAVDIDGVQKAVFKVPTPYDKWTRFTTSFKATAASHTLRLRGEINGTDADAAVDNIVVKESPAVNNSKYVIEMFGRRGELAFPSPIASKPTTAKIKLYGLTLNDVKTYDLINGSWTNGKFIADITGGGVTGISVTQPQIKLKFTSGTYGIIGVVGSKSSINSGSWSESGMSLVLGYDWNSGQNLLPKQNLPASNYATIIFDRQSFPNEKDQNKYDYDWWMEPKVRKTPTYKAVALFWDGVQKELALYAFENDATLSNDPKILGKYKIRAYKYEEINTHLKEFITEYYYVKYPFPDLTALLLNDAMQLAPSTMLGISSSGHGSPESIMNGIISNGKSIKKCFTWVTELRKGPIDYFDFGTNCNTGSLYNLEPLAPFAKYVLASDLTRNSPVPSIGNRPSDRYDTYFKDPSKNAKDILSKMMDDYDVVYNDAAAVAFYKSPAALLSGNTLSSWKQQLTLFDCSQFAAILNKLGGAGANDRIMERVNKTHPELLYSEESWKQADFKAAVEVCFPEYTSFAQDWSKFAIKQMSNRKGLVWDTDKPKGLLVKTF